MTYIGIVHLHPTKRTHWVVYTNGNSFDSYGCEPPQRLSKRNGHCLYSEYRIRGLTRKRDSYCSAYRFCIPYLKKVLGIGFKSAVLNLYYQMIQ